MKRKSPALIARAYHAKVKEMLKGKTEKDIHLSLRQGKSTYLRFERMNSSSLIKVGLRSSKIVFSTWVKLSLLKDYN